MWATLRQRNFSLLWFAGLISYIGNWMLYIALPVAIYELTESTLAISAMLIAGIVPSILFGSVAGVFVDRWERKRTMVIANLLLVLSIVPLLFVRSADLLWLVFLVRFVQSTLSQFFTPAESSLLPQLVDQQYLVSANALNSLNNSLARLVGPSIGGLLAVALGLSGVVIIDILTYLIAAVLIALISGSSRAALSDQSVISLTATVSKVKHDWLDGLRFIRKSPIIRVLFICIAVTSIGEGIMGTLFVPFVNEVLGGEALQVGWLMSAQAVGSLLGGVVIGWIGVRTQPHRLLAVGAILIGIIDLLIFNYPAVIPGIVPAIVLFVVVGVPVVALLTGYDTLIQLNVEDRFRGRVFGAFGTTASLFALVGTTFAGTAGDILGIVPVINIQGYGYFAAGCICLLLIARQIRSLQPERAV
jgi:MFS family permease